jgi:tetratricopeptide (TPR) repeat protein
LKPAEQLAALRKAGQHESSRALAVSLAAAHPLDSELQYQVACIHDFLGLEQAAIPYYESALTNADGLLSAESERGAYLGLGSTQRVLGQYARAVETLARGSKKFPEAREMDVFLAMALHNAGDSKQAVETLLSLLATESSNPDIQLYSRAIKLYAENIDRVW